MSLSDPASLGGFVSGIAVLASLILLYIQLGRLREQIGQAEKNQRAANIVQLNLQNIDYVARMSTPQGADLQRRMFRSEPEITETELFQAMNLLEIYIIMIENILALRRLGLIDSSTFENNLRPARSMLKQPVSRAIWPLLKPNCSAEARAYIDEMLRSEPPHKPIDFVSLFKANFAGTQSADEVLA